MAQQSLKVRIYGNELSLRTDQPERTMRLAAYVDGQMSLFHAKAPDQGTGTLAMLTALNVAEQVIQSEDALRDARRRLEALTARVEAQVRSGV